MMTNSLETILLLENSTPVDYMFLLLLSLLDFWGLWVRETYNAEKHPDPHPCLFMVFIAFFGVGDPFGVWKTWLLAKCLPVTPPNGNAPGLGPTNEEPRRRLTVQ